MSGPNDIDMSALQTPEDATEIMELCSIVDAAGVRQFDLAKVLLCPTRRSLHKTSLQHLCKAFMYLVDAGDASDPPCSMQIGMKARGDAGAASAEALDLSVKRALGQALFEYLWRCKDRGGMKIGSGFLLLPALSSAPVLASPSSGAAAASATGPPSPSAAGGEVGDPARKRQLDELSSAFDELEEHRSLADGLGKGDNTQEREPKRSMIYTSIPDKFRATWATMLTKVGELSYLQHQPEGAKMDSLVSIRAIVTELERLLALDPTLKEEKVFVNDLSLGLDTGLRVGQVGATALWVHDKLMSATEEGQKTDRAKIVKELSDLSKFVAGPKLGSSIAPRRGAPLICSQ